ncbi:TraA family conjugative transfer protein [Hydrogenovibrio marinus]|nr:TraA family conjugative transfer protein [Hydrogenovibrio marinus]
MKMDKTKAVRVAKAGGLLALLIALPVAQAHAATTGAEFQPLYEKFKGWIQGYYGMSAAAAMVGVGAITAVAKQHPLPIAGGLGGAVLLQYVPDIIPGIMTATI